MASLQRLIDLSMPMFCARGTTASSKGLDRVNARVMQDPRIAGMDRAAMPFDGKRMFWGGFDLLVEV
jgi:uncharacterized protein YbaA (DUF1428 family)